MELTRKITVYNMAEGEDFAKTLCPTLLDGVFRAPVKASGIAADGDKNGDRLAVYIPFARFSDSYQPPDIYAKLADKTGAWTLADGDIIALGDTGAAKSYAELAAKAEVFRITSVATFDFGGFPHWEVTAQ